MNKDLISRKAMIKSLDNHGVLCGFAKYLLEHAPAADANEIVHCKDCKYGQMDDIGVMHCHKYHIHKSKDGFCDGGRKELSKYDKEADHER